MEKMMTKGEKVVKALEMMIPKKALKAKVSEM